MFDKEIYFKSFSLLLAQTSHLHSVCHCVILRKNFHFSSAKCSYGIQVNPRHHFILCVCVCVCVCVYKKNARAHTHTRTRARTHTHTHTHTHTYDYVGHTVPQILFTA